MPDCLEYLDCGVRFEFTQDYITSCRYYRKGIKCNILNNMVVLDADGDFLFDVDSQLAKKYGKVIGINK